MAVPCRTCGAEPRDGARFCDGCGSPLQESSRQAEYKQVTVLFADVVGSMDIAAAVGAERLREIMAELVNLSADVVTRYGGTVDKFTGDGLMAVFGAPVALEDHAPRACRAALDIQRDVGSLAAHVDRLDRIDLRLRIGLNSGEVIVGEVGSGAMGYTSIGEQVGIAQRMESVAPSGGVMISGSTARLVEHAADLGEPELVRIKGSRDPVPARRLAGMAADRHISPSEPTFVGREWELGALKGMLHRSRDGSGCVVGVVGPPGIGKSRISREIASLARKAGVEVGTTYCESHTTDIPFYAAAGLLRSIAGVGDIDGVSAKARVRQRFPDANDEDLILLEDLMGIPNPASAMPQIDPDARRRRLTAMVNAAELARTTPTLYVIEDAHWIDEVSEAVLADFLAIVPQTPTVVLITYRPEYSGALARGPRSQTVALEPLNDAHIAALSTELVGDDESVRQLNALIAERAAGNPFFAEEIVRDLSERQVLVGGRGAYRCTDPVAEVNVPSTLQAVIAARIDRLDYGAKQTLNAAAVVGSRFTPGMLSTLGIDVRIDELIAAELIDQTAFGPQDEYAFRHPLIRAVAYESQLRSDRGKLHQRFAAALDQNDLNAALIAEHYEAAGDLRAAYDWHMRAGAWSTTRNHAAAHLSWERALAVADALPADETAGLSLKIAPRSLLCGSAWRRFHPDISARFDELRELCGAADDKVSLAIGMAGFVMEHIIRGRLQDASELASENMALIESIDEAELTVALSFPACVAKILTAELDDALRWSQATIDLANGQTAGESVLIGSPLPLALSFRAFAKWEIGVPGWREDVEQAIAIGRDADPVSRVGVVTFCYQALSHGVLVVDDAVFAEVTTVMKMAEESAEDINVVLARMMMGFALVERGPSEAELGYRILADLRETCLEERYALNTTAAMLLWRAMQLIGRGDFDGAVEQARIATDEIFDSENLINGGLATSTLVEALLARGTTEDLGEAEIAIDKLANTRPGRRWAARDISALRLRALLARARGDQSTYGELRARHRAMAVELGFEGHMAWAAEMT